MRDLSRLVSEAVEDNLYYHRQLRSVYNYDRIANKNFPNIFRRYVVLDVILDRLTLDQDKIDDLQRRFGEIDNVAHAAAVIVPRNTILAKPLYDSSTENKGEALKPVILYPFFPSHFAFPCKPGEHVWVMFESLTEEKSLGYWLFRIVGPDHVDDVNHTHAPREYDPTFYKGADNSPQTPMSNTSQPASPDGNFYLPRYHFKNGIYRIATTNSETGTNQEIIEVDTSYILPNANSDELDPSVIYEDILTTSDGSKKIVYEPVPRYNKRPGDLAIEGSNNSLIVLGVDKDFSTNPRDKSALGAGNIDLVTGRGTLNNTFGKIADNELEAKELDKFYNSLLPEEGNADYDNDRSRVLISQRTKANIAFNLKSYNETPANLATGEPARPNLPDSPDGDAAVVIRSDKVKIIARSDIQFVVQGFSSGENPLGSTIKNGNQNVEQWASITIKSNGDIVFTPSKQGFIKLGGDDADRPLMCAASSAITSNGAVFGSAVKNTAGGQMGGAIGIDFEGKSIPAVKKSDGTPSYEHGTFAAKVLVK